MLNQDSTDCRRRVLGTLWEFLGVLGSFEEFVGVKVSKGYLRGVLRSFGQFRANNGSYGEFRGVLESFEESRVVKKIKKVLMTYCKQVCWCRTTSRTVRQRMIV